MYPFFMIVWTEKYTPNIDITGSFTRCDSACDNVKFFLTKAMGSMATNESVHTDTYVSNFSYDIDFNGRVIFDAVPDAPCERTLNEAVILHVNNTERWFTL